MCRYIDFVKSAKIEQTMRGDFGKNMCPETPLDGNVKSFFQNHENGLKSAFTRNLVKILKMMRRL